MDAQELAKKVIREMTSKDTFSAWLGISIMEFSPGRCTCQMRIRHEMLNGFGVAHGGIIFSLADSALAFAANCHGRVSLGLDNSISYPAPVHVDDEIIAIAEELSLTNRTAFYRVHLTNQNAQLVGIFHGTVYRTEKKHIEEA